MQARHCATTHSLRPEFETWSFKVKIDQAWSNWLHHRYRAWLHSYWTNEGWCSDRLGRGRCFVSVAQLQDVFLQVSDPVLLDGHRPMEHLLTEPGGQEGRAVTRRMEKWFPFDFIICTAIYTINRQIHEIKMQNKEMTKLKFTNEKKCGGK